MRFICLSLLCLTLAACGSDYGYGDPSLPLDPNAGVSLYSGYVTSTAQAFNEERVKATEQAAKEAGRTEREIALLMAPVTAQAAMLELQITAGVATDIASRATATANAAQSTAMVNVAQSTATRDAEVKRLARENTLAIAWARFWGVVILGTLGAVLFLSYRFIKKWEDALIEARKIELEIEKQKRAMIPIKGGYIYMGPNGPEFYQPGKTVQPPDSRLLGEGWYKEDAEEEIAPDGDAIELVAVGIEKFGGYSDRLPGWRLMDWSPSRWQGVIGPWVDAGIVDTTPGHKTFLDKGGPYENIQELYMDLQAGKVKAPTLSSYPMAG